MSEQLKAIQRKVGVPDDGVYGPNTERAIAVALDCVLATPVRRRVGKKGIALMHEFEGCKLTAYPDPGSADGKPWTIGWGSTGAGIGPGTVWTQDQADARFENDLVSYGDEVSKVIGDAPTTQDQFDALVAFHYNTGKISSATLTKKHIARDYEGAAKEFGKWVYNDGKVMKGLVRRREAEANLYRGLA